MIRLSLLTLAGVLLAAPAFAQFKDVDGNIHIQNLTPNQKIEYSAGNGLTKKVSANFCGLLVVGVPSSSEAMPASINVDGVTLDVATLPVASLPSCVNNVLKEPRATNFKDATGRVVLVGKTPGIQAEIVYNGVAATKSLTANTCGYAKISNGITTPAPASFTYAGTAYTTASLPVETPNRCIDGNKFVFTR